MTNTATEAQEVTVIDEIQVSGLQVFEGHRWREAILHYLNGVWTNKDDVMYRPKVHFGVDTDDNPCGHVTLRLEPATRTYYAQGNPIANGQYPRTSPFEMLVTSDRQTDVEQGLIRFIRNDGIKVLVIRLGPTSSLCLWKSAKRGELNVSASGITDIVDEALKRLVEQA